MVRIEIHQKSKLVETAGTLLHEFTEEPEYVLLVVASVSLPKLLMPLLVLRGHHLAQDRNLAGLLDA